MTCGRSSLRLPRVTGWMYDGACLFCFQARMVSIRQIASSCARKNSYKRSKTGILYRLLFSPCIFPPKSLYLKHRTYSASGGNYVMLCQDTGCTEAIHIPKDVIELAQELNIVLEAIDKYGQGQGEISLKVQPGRKIPFIDWTARKFRAVTSKKVL